MMEYLGFDDVHVLYGGISAWYREAPYGAGYDTDSTWAGEPNDGTFVATERHELRATKGEIEAAISALHRHTLCTRCYSNRWTVLDTG
eukprot:COSAG01_NODE_254_length_20214_cov_25.086254_19_plen_88_part_00